MGVVEEGSTDGVRSRAHAYALWQSTPVERGLDRLAIATVTFIVLGSFTVSRGDQPHGLQASSWFLGLAVVASAARVLQKAADDDRIRDAWRTVGLLSIAGFLAGAATFVTLEPISFAVSTIVTGLAAAALVAALTVQSDHLSAELADRWRRSNPTTYRLIALATFLGCVGIAAAAWLAEPEPIVQDGWHLPGPPTVLPAAVVLVALGIAVWAFARCVPQFRAMRVAAKALRVPIV